LKNKTLKKLREIEDELIRLNQAADLAEKLFVDGQPEEYIVDAMIMHARRISKMFQEIQLCEPS